MFCKTLQRRGTNIYQMPNNIISSLQGSSETILPLYVPTVEFFFSSLYSGLDLTGISSKNSNHREVIFPNQKMVKEGPEIDSQLKNWHIS